MSTFSFDFRDQLQGDWDTAKGYLTLQLDQLFAALSVPEMADNGSTAPPPVTAPEPEVVPTWNFVSYTTGAATSSVTVNGLDLQTDFAYRFFIQTGLTSASDYITARPNNDSTAINAIGLSSVSQAGGPTDYGASAQTGWNLSGTVVGRGFAGELTMHAGINHKPLGDFRLTSDDSIGGFISYFGSIWRNSTNNITSMTFLLNGGKTCDWRVWCAKPRVS